MYCFLFPPEADLHDADYASTDWIQWQNDSLGLVAKKILSPAESAYSDNYIQKGDRLIHLDYRPAGKPEVVKVFVQKSTPGTVITYGIERAEDGHREPLLIPLSFFPPGTLYEYPVGGMIFMLYNIGACVVIIFLAVLLFPFLSSQWKVNGFMFLLLLSGLSVHLLNAGRAFNLFQHVQQPEIGIVYDKILILSQAFGWILASLAVFKLNHPKAHLSTSIFYLISLIAGGYLVYQILYDLNSIYSHYPYLTAVVAWIFLLSNLQVPSLNQLKTGTLSFRSLKIFQFILQAILLLIAGWMLIYPTRLPTNELLIACHIPLMYTVLLQTRSGFKYGKVNTILVRTLVLLTVYGILTALYYWASGIPFTRSMVHIGFVLGISVLIYRLAERYRFRVENFLATARERKRKQFLQFIQHLPRIINSQELIEESRKHTQDYFETELCNIRVVPKEAMPEVERFSGEEIQFILEQTGKENRFWARSKELSGLIFNPQIEQKLIQNGIHLLFTFFLAGGEKGWLILGKRKKGFYNLEDVETVIQLVQQMRLSLDILYLIEREKILAEKTMEANLIALRAQINPHFLFNTFNSISDLIHVNPAGAEEALEKLAFIFRYTLKSSKDNFALLENELQLIRNYLDIEQIRFGERLSVTINYDPDSLDVSIPAFTLQTIVENCIKHGISKIKEKGIVKIDIQEEDDFLVLNVYDNGPGIDLSRIRKSTGLSNILQRLDSLYNRSDLLQFQNTGNGTLVTLKIPYDDE